MANKTRGLGPEQRITASPPVLLRCGRGQAVEHLGVAIGERADRAHEWRSGRRLRALGLTRPESGLARTTMRRGGRPGWR